MPGIYSYDSPRKLFEKVVRDFTAFNSNPNEDGLFTIIFPFYHLREWICPGEHIHEQIKRKPEDQWSKEERHYVRLYGMSEYQLVGALCNHAKHFDHRKNNLDERLDKLQGARFGRARFGDSFGVTHFTVDGIEIRFILSPVFMVYFDYFKQLPK